MIFNFYPIPVGSFFIAAGAYFSGDKMIKIKGHSDEFVNAAVQSKSVTTISLSTRTVMSAAV